MNELKLILEAADATDATDEPVYLATVVDVDGSAYRRPGAKMLILPGNEHVGTISGGCLERDLCQQAAQLCRSGPRLISFDTRTDSANFNARYNLGCSGIIYVLVEPVTNDVDCPLRFVREVFESGIAQVVGTVYQSDGFEPFRVGSRFVGDSLSDGPANPLREPMEQVAVSGKPVCCQFVSMLSENNDSVARVFIEKLAPPKPLWIFGAGSDVIPLANVASELGWSVTVIGDRPSGLAAERFPSAKRLLCTNLDEVKANLVPTTDTAAVLMTHSFSKDAMLLPWLCHSDLAYVGLLGPKSRTGKIIKQLHFDRTLGGASRLDRIKTPVGLDIGATNPAEIAISIVAEIIATGHERKGGALAERRQPIHDSVCHRLFELGTDTVTLRRDEPSNQAARTARDDFNY